VDSGRRQARFRCPALASRVEPFAFRQRLESRILARCNQACASALRPALRARGVALCVLFAATSANVALLWSALGRYSVALSHHITQEII